MEHDFHGMDSTKLKNSPDGKGKCSGIMDYTDSTGGWSKCSNADIQKFLNGLKKNCLIREYFHDISHFFMILIKKNSEPEVLDYLFQFFSNWDGRKKH